MKKIYKKTKRVLDILFSLILIILLLPLIIIISFIIKIESRGPVLFKQKRIGFNKKVFIIYKFRSMKDNSEFIGTGQYSYQDDPRVTNVGKVIRRTSLDELPQLINIIRGDMSFIGPRPTLTYHPHKIEDYPIESLKRFLVKPGITGLAQIRGRKELTWEERFKYDIYYVNNLSFLNDMKIFFLTLKKVFLMEKNINTKKTVK